MSIALRLSDFTILCSMALDPEQLLALHRQGGLSRERRRGRTYHKLRFRVGGRQRVKYVPATKLAAVATELVRLQSSTLRSRALMRRDREARRALRDAKAALVPRLTGGLYFHGHTIRQRRAT